jgi:hypothetical protein
VIRRRSPRARGTGRFPLRSPLASLGQHVAFDVGEEHVFWARSRPSRSGLRLLEWGRIDVGAAGAEELLREIARVPWIRAVRVEVPIRSPELRHRRVSLPVLTPAQARKIGRRRVAEFLAEQSEACVGSFVRMRRKGAFPIWLVAVPASAPELFERRWSMLGFDVHRLSSEPLALGNLARLLTPNPPGQLTAIFDLHRDGGDCVICDDQGWVFNRVIAVRAGRARSAGEASGPTSRIANAADDGSPLDATMTERLSTELQRTVRYVERELQLGSVTRVALAGDLPGLELLAVALRRSLDVTIAPLGDLCIEGPARGLDPAAARAVGLAMAPDPSGCSLLPPESKLRQSMQRARMQLRAALCAVLVLGVGGLSTSALRLHGARRDLAEMSEKMGSDEKRLEIIAQTARERGAARSLLDGLATLRRPEPPWQAILQALAASAPADVAFEEVHVARPEGSAAWEASLVMEARGASVADAAEQVSALGERLRGVPFLAPTRAERDPTRQTIQEEQRARVFFEMRAALAVLHAPSDAALAPVPPGGEE